MFTPQDLYHEYNLMSIEEAVVYAQEVDPYYISADKEDQGNSFLPLLITAIITIILF